MGYTAEQKNFNKASKVLETKITKIQRGSDGAIIEVGQETRTGKVLQIVKDKMYAGGMAVETDRKGHWTAVPNVVI